MATLRVSQSEDEGINIRRRQLGEIVEAGLHDLGARMRKLEMNTSPKHTQRADS